MIEISSRIIAEYQAGLKASQAEAHRRVGLLILTAALESGCVSEVPSRTLRKTVTHLQAGPLQETDAEALSDELDAYLRDKNGHSVVQRDREDKILRAVFEVFYSSVGDEGLESMAHDVEEQLSGRSPEISVQQRKSD